MLMRINPLWDLRKSKDYISIWKHKDGCNKGVSAFEMHRLLVSCCSQSLVYEMTTFGKIVKTHPNRVTDTWEVHSILGYRGGNHYNNRNSVAGVRTTDLWVMSPPIYLVSIKACLWGVRITLYYIPSPPSNLNSCLSSEYQQPPNHVGSQM